ncbi:Pectinesterase [Phytophthora palmivora]|uniref:Pectinesterase n=1 Tax=Phytophthora palmivora TaxID=4796 RepID=A0A2P4YID2_9STRA|nr:Pectinesterase [Phytophthora palmivora]
MQILAPLVTLAAFIVATEGTCTGPNARTQPPAGAIVIDPTGAYRGSFKTVSEGVAKLPNTIAEHTLFLFPGTYKEQVTVPNLNGPLVVQGYTCDTTSYAANKVTITHAMAQKDVPASVTKNRNDYTTTLLLKSSNVKVYNLNVANTAGNVGQAIAMKVDGANYGFYACKLTGYQDTLYANKGPAVFAKSYISGSVDFVFGLYAKAWFEKCDIESIGKGSITANGRSDASNPSEYVFNNARVFGSKPGTAFLGRPWRPYARVVFQNSYLSDVVNPQGWQLWNGDKNTANVYFKEYNNKGPGAATDKRVAFSGTLKKPVAITEILGEGYQSAWWVDKTFM